MSTQLITYIKLIYITLEEKREEENFGSNNDISDV